MLEDGVEAVVFECLCWIQTGIRLTSLLYSFILSYLLCLNKYVCFLQCVLEVGVEAAGIHRACVFFSVSVCKHSNHGGKGWWGEGGGVLKSASLQDILTLNEDPGFQPRREAGDV